MRQIVFNKLYYIYNLYIYHIIYQKNKHAIMFILYICTCFKNPTKTIYLKKTVIFIKEYYYFSSFQKSINNQVSDMNLYLFFENKYQTISSLIISFDLIL